MGLEATDGEQDNWPGVPGDFDDDDVPAAQLHNERDRPELRLRYYGLLQELRVLLPGVQILVAFLFVVPFNSRFTDLDELGRDLYGIALTTGVLAVITFAAPTAFHRVASRRSRSARLVWGIRMARIGFGFLAISMWSAVTLVARVVFHATAAWLLSAGIAAAMLGVWVVLPLVAGRGHLPRD